MFLSFVDLHLFAILRTSLNFWGLSDSDRKSTVFFPSSAGKVWEVAIAWRFHTCKYHSFWLVAIANYKSYASIVSKLVVFPRRMAYCGLIIFHESRTTSMKALRWVAKQKCHLRKENYIHVCNFTDKQNKRPLYCGVKTL